MTVGYPDYGRSVQSQVLPLITLSENIVAETLSSIEYIGDLPYLEIAWDCTGLANRYLIQLSFSDDSGGNTFAGSSSVVTVPFKTGWISYKAKGRYVQVIVDNKTATDVGPINIYLRGSTEPSSQYENQYQGYPLLQYDQTVTALSNVTVSAEATIAGQAELSIYHDANSSWHVLLQYWDWPTGGWLNYVWLYGTDYGRSATITVRLPAAPIQAVLFNDDGTDRRMVLGLTT